MQKQKTAVAIAFLSAGLEGQADDLGGGMELARARGYRVMNFSLNDFPAMWRLQRTLVEHHVRGVILGRSYGYDKLPSLDWDSFPVVVKSRPPFPVPFPSVRADYFAGVHKLWQEARDRGYRRIGVVTLRHPSGNYLDDWERYGAALACAQTVPSAQRVPPFFGVIWDDRAVLRWFKKNRPDVVIGFNTRVLFTLQAAGVRIPKEVGFATMLYNPASPADQSVTGLMDPRAIEAEMAVNLLDRLLHQPRSAPPPRPVDEVFKQPWVEGVTLPPR